MEQLPYPDSEQSVSDWASLMEKARGLHRAGRRTSAGEICTQILSRYPSQPDALHLLGIIAHQDGNSDKAMILLQKAVESNPFDLNICKNLILILREMGQMTTAASYCRKALQSGSNNYQIYHGLGDLFFRDGHHEEAVACYEKVLAINPELGTVWGNLGNALQGCRRYDQAISCYRKALPLDPDNADLYYNMAIAYSNKEMFDKANLNFEAALVLNPDHAQALFNLGNACKSQGNLEKAIKCYQKCIHLNADDIDARHNLANAFYAQGQLQAAMDAYTEVLRRKPDHILVLNNLACLFKDLGVVDQAVSMLGRSIEIAPNDAAAYMMLGQIYQERNESEKALSVFQKALSLAPNNHDALMSMGRLLKQEGRYEEGLKYLNQAVAFSPGVSNAWWYYYLSLPILYDTEADIAVHRKRLSDGMATLISRVKLETPEECKKALAGIGCFTNFYLQYQGGNDLELQKRYGRFVHRVMAANYPQWVVPLSMPELRKSGKIKVGYLSSFMRTHTVGHFLMGWLENHDRMQFEVHGYYIGDSIDNLTKAIEQKTDRFYHMPGNIEAMARQIRDDELHILVYTDIGMFAPATQLAGLRLAPIQCKGWGHPVTTGLPTIDYYLSSDLMEPADAGAHYTEALVRLPNLALALKPPQIPENRKTRKEFGLSDDDFIFLTSQSLFKYLPQYDEIYPRIGSQVKKAKFVFISNPNTIITEQFRKRIENAFNHYNLSMRHHCVFQPRLSPDDFMRLNQISDVLLDPISWSGGKTTIEGISCAMPVVTCPGTFMRGRHAYAMLKMMDITETIATDVRSYIDIASRLGNDRSFFNQARNAIVSRRHRLFNDETCIRSLEAFYRSVVETKLSGQEDGFRG